LIFNFEYNFPIVPSAHLKGLVFFDMGRGFDDGLITPPAFTPAQNAVVSQVATPSSIHFDELKKSWGWGFWWLSPLGPLRFEWGYIINRKPSDQASQFEFNIGTVF
jgi:outer membrane protein insertion porin family